MENCSLIEGQRGINCKWNLTGSFDDSGKGSLNFLDIFSVILYDRRWHDVSIKKKIANFKRATRTNLQSRNFVIALVYPKKSK